MIEKDMRNLAFRDKYVNEIGVFKGKSLGQASLKATNRGHAVRLRERGTKKCICSQESEQVDKPQGRTGLDA